jgi:flagellar assembly factor FliW
MQVHTTRFGTVEIQPEDILLFSRGLIGFETHCHWVLLADARHSGVAWLQSLADPAVALAMVSPRRYVPGYRVLIQRDQLTPLELAVLDEAFVLVPLGRNETGLTLNLRAPLIVNLTRRIGRQVVTGDEQPLQLTLPKIPLPLRKIA